MFDTDIKNQVFLITGVNGQLGIALCQTIINSGGKIELKRWFQRMELLGFKMDTIIEEHYKNKRKQPPYCKNSCGYEDYIKIKKKLEDKFDNI